MKKIFALFIATAMAVSFYATAMAMVGYTATDTIFADITAPLNYNNDEKRMELAETDNTVEYGKSAFFQILYKPEISLPITDNAVFALDTYSNIEKLKIKAKWKTGAHLVEYMAIVKKDISNNVDSDKDYIKPTAKKHAYFLQIKTKESTSVDNSPVIGALSFSNSKATITENGVLLNEATYKIDNDVDVAFNVFYNNSYLNPTAIMPKANGNTVEAVK